MSEIRNVRKARLELETTRAERRAELAHYAARTRQLQAEVEAAPDLG